ncbi:PREDICTED: protein trichome birefringence-like 23 [Lupinus angustifolius]|uniref:protein trichome birefringence-like 23 n=1 Tax=Lupinus angustifolius TaxID=3871 RepID=UPI00092E42FF|nr:PREDICTED: protein trichome birefringence-like 23 [Lupinus angustifolius]
MRIDYLKHGFGYKHKNLILKLVVITFFFGLAFKLVFFHSLPQKFVPLLEHTFPEKTTIVPEHQNTLVSEHVPENEDQSTNTEKCDYLSGDWVPNPKGPLYSENCNHIEPYQNCLKNGRPDREFLYWKWTPRKCDLPSFDPYKFLNAMRNKTWALIGDSITRNHVKSLMCMLSTVGQSVVVYEEKGFKSKTWHFSSFNFTLSVIWSPFLVEAGIVEDINGVPNSEIELHLDKLSSKWKNQFMNFDYIILSCGKWFLRSAIYYENDTILGCHSCPKSNLKELEFTFAYRKAIKFVLNYIVSSHHKGMIFYRTFTPDHFENGEWSNGGTCNRTKPVKEGEMEIKYLNKMLRDIELMEVENAVIEASRNGVNLKVVDFVPLSLLRPDGHPGPYREFHPFDKKDKNGNVQNDCLHWCLPGPIDSWNDILMEMVVNNR